MMNTTNSEELFQLKAELSKRDIEGAINAHKLDSNAAELFRDAVSGKELDAKELDARAIKFARLSPAPMAPQTEGGAQNRALPDAPGSGEHYSFNTPGGVPW